MPSLDNQEYQLVGFVWATCVLYESTCRPSQNPKLGLGLLVPSLEETKHQRKQTLKVWVELDPELDQELGTYYGGN